MALSQIETNRYRALGLLSNAVALHRSEPDKEKAIELHEWTSSCASSAVFNGASPAEVANAFLRGMSEGFVVDPSIGTAEFAGVHASGVGIKG